MSLLHVDLAQSVHQDLRREADDYRMSHQAATGGRGLRHRLHVFSRYEPAVESVNAKPRPA